MQGESFWACTSPHTCHAYFTYTILNQAAEGMQCMHLIPVRHSHRQTPKLQAGQSVSPTPQSEGSHLHEHAFAGSVCQQDLGTMV